MGWTVVLADGATTRASLPSLDTVLLARVAVLSLILTGLLIVGDAMLSQHGIPSERHASLPLRTAIDRVEHAWNTWPVALQLCLMAGITLLCWSPYIIHLYPGVLWFDTGDQLAQYFGVAALIALITITSSLILFPALVYPVMNVQRSDANKVLVVPMQLIARYVYDHPSDVKDRERKVIDRINLVPVAKMARKYNPYLADPIIHGTLREQRALPDYVKVWLQQGFRHPASYINSFAAVESG